MGEAMDALQRAYKAWRSRQDDGQLELDVDNQDGGPGRESRPLSALQGGEMNDETTETVDYEGLAAYLGSLDARGRYDGKAVSEKLAQFGVNGPVPNEIAGMVLSDEMVRRLGAEVGSYGGWGFQHSANVRAIAKLGERGAA